MQLTQKVAAGATVTKADAASRSFDAVFSTESIDSYGEIVVQDWDLDRYRANPVLLLQHNAFGGLLGGVRAGDLLPIGRVENIRVENKALRGRVVFATEDANPLAERVFQLFREGAMRAFSVGFVSHSSHEKTIEGRSVTVLEANELFEISAVTVPANGDAVVAARIKAALADVAPPPPPDGKANERLRRLIGLPEAPEAHTPTPDPALAAVLAMREQSTAGQFERQVAEADARVARARHEAANPSASARLVARASDPVRHAAPGSARLAVLADDPTFPKPAA